MNQKAHPWFAGWFQRFFLRAWCVAAGSMGAGLWLLKHDHERLGSFLCVVFVVSATVTLAFLYWRLHHVACPRCAHGTKTGVDARRSRWVARCGRCGVEWDLGLGVGDAG